MDQAPDADGRKGPRSRIAMGIASTSSGMAVRPTKPPDDQSRAMP